MLSSFIYLFGSELWWINWILFSGWGLETYFLLNEMGVSSNSIYLGARALREILNVVKCNKIFSLPHHGCQQSSTCTCSLVSTNFTLVMHCSPKLQVFTPLFQVFIPYSWVTLLPSVESLSSGASAKKWWVNWVGSHLAPSSIQVLYRTWPGSHNTPELCSANSGMGRMGLKGY